MSDADLAEPIAPSRDDEYGDFLTIGFTGDPHIARKFLDLWNPNNVREDCHALFHTVERAAVFFGYAGEHGSSRPKCDNAALAVLATIDGNLRAAGRRLDAIIHFGAQNIRQAEARAGGLFPRTPFFVAGSEQESESVLGGVFPALEEKIHFDRLNAYELYERDRHHLPGDEIKAIKSLTRPAFSNTGLNLVSRAVRKLQKIPGRLSPRALRAELN